ncbi:HAMP domain-containing histidine kinase [Myxococcus sp. CA051A]|uniref:sensor histidine kinase n=1 Tax=unclassified Myxococcus TaxID=2648731 RepID=UPI00157A8592|nr:MULTISPECIES: HAMP domain-containing sensor histidine kinase [unclassified Myxococcus]NTX37262.1 HAMP domain-containing histidine kinase [Myxococcus sp. CA033]NTX60124.1 HAMP domain-containing histidine kinase [Myxococcus sp. CA051A]
MSLRAWLAAIMGGLALLTLVAATALIVLTNAQNHSANTLGNSVEGLHLAEELEIDLLIHFRLSGVTGPVEVTSERIRGRTLQSIESSFPRLLEGLNRSAFGAPEQALIREVDEHFRQYLATQREAARLPLRQRAQRVIPALDASLDSLERLVQLNVEEARTARESSADLNRMGNTVGLVLCGLLLVGLVTGTYLLRRIAWQPLRDISQSMRRFGAGRKRTRAPVAGPTELRDMARTFNEMANSLTHQQEQQLAFLAGVAHELRNPLSALKLSTALTERTRAQLTPERMQRTLALVGRQVERLDRMVGDLLDSTRIEAGKLELRPEVRDARELARGVVELYRSSDGGHVLQLDVPETPLLVRVDPDRLEQVMANLVSNALKYSPSGSRVDVAVRRDQEDVLLLVKDQGIGVTEEEKGMLFAPFQRLGDARSKRAPGVGLGLSVARRIVEAHGGRIEVESTPGVGSTFCVRLALATQEAGGAVELPAATAPVPPDALH